MANKKIKINKPLLKRKIKESSTSIATLSKIMGVSYKTLWKYIQKNQDIKDLIEEQRKTMVEQAEDLIYVAIESGDIKTAKWLLKVKGGDEWNETTKVEHSGGVDISINIIDKKKEE